jgi:di/tricarboxylate transporter
MMRFLFLVVTLLVMCAVMNATSVTPTAAPTASPTSRKPTFAPSGPTRSPSLKPTRSPTYRSKASSIYTDFAPTKTLKPEEQQGVVIALIVLLVVLMAFEVTTPEVLFLIALCILILTEILTLSQALSGFSNAAVLTIGSLFLVIGAVEKSHVVDWIGRKAFGAGGSETVGRLRMYCTTFSLSCFLNNTPLVALFMPIVKDWGRMRGIGASQLLLPLNYAIIAGSYGSMIGTSSNQSIQGIMEADRGYSFPFFAPFPIGIVCFIALALYMVFAAPLLLPKNKTGLLREARDSAKNLIAEVYVSEHSPMIGKNVEVFATSLGIEVSSVIKIRRAVPHNNSTVDLETGESIQPASILDYNYIKRVASFWEKKSVIVDTEERNKTPEDGHRAVEYTDIVAPAPHELIGANDIVFFSSAHQVVEKMMKSILGESKGLRMLKSDVLALPGFGTELVECVISDKNPYIGKKVHDVAQEFSQTYQAGLITVRGKEWGTLLTTDGKKSPENQTGNQASGYELATSNEIEEEVIVDSQIEMTDLSNNNNLSPDTNDQRSNSEAGSSLIHDKSLEVPSVSDHVLAPGDVVLCVTNQKNVEELSGNRDFFVVSTVGALPKPLTFWGVIPVFCFLGLLVIAANELIDICPLSMTLAAFFFMGGWLVPKDITRYVDLRLLMLLGTSLSFAVSMTTSGLALRIASNISDSHPTPFTALLLIYVITLVITEIISNNAAGALMYPIAVSLADQLGVSFKPFAMGVMIACTAGFMCPIGYQTHVMVWGPGGYQFRDFLVFGFIPNLIYWFIGCAMITVVFPFN